VDDVREIEDADEVGEVLLLDVREDRGADCADEEFVGAAREEGRVSMRGLAGAVLGKSGANVYLFTAQKAVSVDCFGRVSQASM
jgi:hypothetical protein